MALSLLFFNVSLDFTHFTLIWGYLQNRDAPSYQKDVPKSLGKAESCLGEAIDLINLIVSASEAEANNG
jgi:hypothetical protein